MIVCVPGFFDLGALAPGTLAGGALGGGREGGGDDGDTTGCPPSPDVVGADGASVGFSAPVSGSSAIRLGSSARVSLVLVLQVNRLAERLPGDHYSCASAAFDLWSRAIACLCKGHARNLAPLRKIHYLRRAGRDDLVPSRVREACGMKEKSEVMLELRKMLGDVFTAKAQGEAYGRLARAHGYVDGYMRALLELGFVSKDELLDVVNAERERASGPAMRTMSEIVVAA